MISRQIRRGLYDVRAQRWLAWSAGADVREWPGWPELLARLGTPSVTLSEPGLFIVPGPAGEVIVGRFNGLLVDALFLALPTYRVIADPFSIDERFPPRWDARGEQADAEWPDEPLPRRTVAQIAGLLKAGESVWLLGAAQALLDGSKIAIERPQPAREQVRSLWQLLPESTRRELHFSTLAFNAEANFDVLVLPSGLAPPAGYLTEEQARSYPEGRYELGLQVAAEAGDQAALDRLFARHSTRDAIRRAVWLLVVVALLALGMRWAFQR